MIKLIASDVDGTLVKDSKPEIYPEIFPVIRSLKDKGVIMAIASGRQYHSIARMFEPVKDDLIFIAENGAHVRCRDQDMSITKMDKEAVFDMLKSIEAYDNIDIIVSVPGLTYIKGDNPSFVDLIKNKYRNRVELTDDFYSIKEDIIKFALYRKGSIRELGEGEIIPRFKDRCHCCMAGDEWVDFIDFKTDKGNALKTVMDFFHIKKEEAAAFGDNANDLGMLLAVGESYAVDTAPDEIKEKVKHVCGGFKDRGVLKVLTEISKGI
ncbi:MAG: HAD family phosphatase [Lachnospiraceae bacterium]|nr:HAD family phosphatase [Lachnospiraceae bacterium]